MNIEEIDGYEAAKAAHDGALTAAKAAGDELGELRAQLAWRDQQDGFRQKRDQVVAQKAAVEQAKVNAKAQFASAPEAVYAGLSDPAAILEAAKAAHEAVVAATGAQGQFREPSQRWPQPPAGNQGPPPGAHEYDDPVRWNEDMEKVRTMPKQPNQGIANPVFKKMMDYTVDKLWNSPLKNAQ